MRAPDADMSIARAELQDWYLNSLVPKLVRATTTGVVDPTAVAVLDVQVRTFLEIAHPHAEAA